MLGGFGNCPTCGNARMLVRLELVDGVTNYTNKCAGVGCTNRPAYIPKRYRRSVETDVPRKNL